MLENELKNIWKNSSKEELVKFNKSKLILDLDSKLENFEKRMKNRDRKMLVWGILVTIGLTYLFFSDTELITGIICLTIIPYVILQFYLIKKVKQYKVDYYSLPLKEYLLKHQQYLIKERKLDENAFYWKILPGLPALTLTIIVSMFGTELILNIIFITIFFVIVFLFVKWRAKKRFDPLMKKVEETIAELDAGE
jgi:amino acid transporter